MSFAIVVDSTCDMSLEELAALDVAMVPLTISVGGKDYLDQFEISSAEFYERMAAAEELPKSAQPSPAAFIEAFGKAQEKSGEGVLSINIAHALSGTVGSAQLAASQVDFPVEVVDCAGATAQCALLVQEAARMRDAGINLTDAANKLKELIGQTTFYIACETLENLLKGGRLQPQEAEAAVKLNIKPVMTFDEIGVLRAFDKVRGMSGVRKLYASELERLTAERGRQRVRIAHANNPAEAENLLNALKGSGIDFVDAGSCICGATVGTHLGAGALGIAFITEQA